MLNMTRRMGQIISEIGVIRNNEFARLIIEGTAVELNAQRVRPVVLYGGFAAVALSALLCFLVQGRLNGLNREAGTAARNVSEAVEQILNSAHQQTASCAEQAAAVVRASAAMQEISQSGLQITRQTKEMAERASTAGICNLTAIEDTNSALQAIGEQAQAAAENALSLHEKTQTAREIVAAVNEISQQSHLLALNAAIQAAAAGEHGFAFAAVAAEIKKLADQSQEATRQVRSILSDIQKSIHTSVLLTGDAVKRVEQGKQQADAAAGTIREINNSIQQNAHALQHAGGDTNEPQIAFQRIMQAFKTIDHGSEQTADAARQLERSAINLMTLGRQLAQVTERY
jgi:methyl-accepting chemotaxis protein